VRSGEASTGDLSQGSTFARQAVTSYVSVVTSSIVLDEVIKELDLDTTSTELAKQVEASSPTNTVLIDISYTDPDPEKAARVTNTIGTVFANVVSDELENSSDGSQARVQLQTIEPAQVPDAPVSPKVARNLTLGLLLGLFLGIGIAVLRAVLDTRIHSKADIAEVTNLPIIGTVGKDAESAKRPLIALDDPRNPLVESYRTLRTNLQYINIDSNDKKSIVITSAGPSEGKSTTAVNLAIVMADAGSRVLIIDADLRKPKVSKLLGIEGSNGLSDLLVGRLNLEDALQRWGRRQIFVLPAGRIPPNPSELLQSTAMSRLMDKLEGTSISLSSTHPQSWSSLMQQFSPKLPAAPSSSQPLEKPVRKNLPAHWNRSQPSTGKSSASFPRWCLHAVRIPTAMAHIRINRMDTRQRKEGNTVPRAYSTCSRRKPARPRG
jgi:Capsular polysaccharide biosynthesis protein